MQRGRGRWGNTYRRGVVLSTKGVVLFQHDIVEIRIMGTAGCGQHREQEDDEEGQGKHFFVKH
jgi:hypothetical protein